MVKQGLIGPSQYDEIAQQAVPNPDQRIHTIADGPEFNKWDEALHNRGAIRIPRELDEPQTWLNQDHIQKILKGMGADREDFPDGSVILRIQQPVS